jgi:hypothetical protein
MKVLAVFFIKICIQFSRWIKPAKQPLKKLKTMHCVIAGESGKGQSYNPTQYYEMLRDSVQAQSAVRSLCNELGITLESDLQEDE